MLTVCSAIVQRKARVEHSIDEDVDPADVEQIQRIAGGWKKRFACTLSHCLILCPVRGLQHVPVAEVQSIFSSFRAKLQGTKARDADSDELAAGSGNLRYFALNRVQVGPQSEQIKRLLTSPSPQHPSIRPVLFVSIIPVLAPSGARRARSDFAKAISS